jgi:hypothetical protein
LPAIFPTDTTEPSALALFLSNKPSPFCTETTLFPIKSTFISPIAEVADVASAVLSIMPPFIALFEPVVYT